MFWCVISHKAPSWISTNKHVILSLFPWLKGSNRNHQRTVTICTRTIFSVARTERASPLAKAQEQRPGNTHCTFTHSQTKIRATGRSFCHLLFKRFNLGHHRKAKTLNRSSYYRLATNMWLHKQLKFNTHTHTGSVWTTLKSMKLHTNKQWTDAFGCLASSSILSSMFQGYAAACV